MIVVMGRKPFSLYLLSNHIRIVTCFDLENAVVCPKVHRVSDACYSSFVHLNAVSTYMIREVLHVTNHLRSFCTSNGELEIRILLPVSEKKGELGEEAVVDISRCRNRCGV